MTKQHLRDIVFRYFLFLLGIFTISLGIAFSTSSGLGTTPLASLPYTLSLGFAPSMGTFMMLLNITCFLIQLALLRKRFPKAWVLQLLSWFEPANYGMQLACLAAGIVLVAAGLSIEVSANTIMLSVDGLVKAIVMVTEKNFGKIKVGLDVTLVTLSIVCSFVLIGGIEGIREGTVLAALLVGTLSRVFTPLITGQLPKREKTKVLPTNFAAQDASD